MTAYISVRNLTLDVPYYVQTAQAAQTARSWGTTLVGALFSPPKRRFARILDGVSFDISAGSRVALLGRNGAGKTTLLRVLSGAFQPTRGEVEVAGARQALLNLGLGFNPEATLTENVFLRATAMGMSPAEIRGMVESIFEFSELGGVAERRLSTLSSGQRMRLGFAISTSVQHDIMLMDEWFGAGDASFVNKARARLTDRVASSQIVVLASHNFNMLRKICDEGIVIERGKVAYIGEVNDAISAYKDIYRAVPMSEKRSAA
ncbi:ABC transporter ATP-binding protein [Luteimonas sp. SJ-92]|uniref:ABC transporter ATP-binding protein n=1 Tax=Luteimonas salinisoli TaxID=2752307 RepID=A0A853J835_9GAMM|nr:ABC transporter ATP-binding protein [Luteimonas salinisoli]